MSTTPIRVLLTDDHAIVRKGIRALLATEQDIQVVGEAGDGMEAVAQAKALQPDVILMDLVMPKLDGIEATRQITAELPDTGVLVLTSLQPMKKCFQRSKRGPWAICSRIRTRKRSWKQFIKCIEVNRRLSRPLHARCWWSYLIRPGNSR